MLRYEPREGGPAELEALAEVTGEAGREAYDQHDELGAFQHDGDAADVLADLFDEALHRDRCYPWTAERVPVLADLAVDDRLSDRHRALVVHHLFRVATVGRRHGAETADTLAARAAVAGAVPRIIARASDFELYAFLAAALAAACPEAGGWPVEGLRELARRYAGTEHERAAELIVALAAGAGEADDAGALAELLEAELE